MRGSEELMCWHRERRTPSILLIILKPSSATSRWPVACIPSRWIMDGQYRCFPVQVQYVVPLRAAKKLRTRIQYTIYNPLEYRKKSRYIVWHYSQGDLGRWKMIAPHSWGAQALLTSRETCPAARLILGLSRGQLTRYGQCSSRKLHVNTTIAKMRLLQSFVPSLLLSSAAIVSAASSWSFEDATVTVQTKGAGVGTGAKDK